MVRKFKKNCGKVTTKKLYGKKIEKQFAKNEEEKTKCRKNREEKLLQILESIKEKKANKSASLLIPVAPSCF